MKLKPGCGCLVLVLALVNLIAFLFWIVAAAVGGENTTGTTIVLSVLMGLFSLGNGIVCVVVGWGAVRAGGLKLPSVLEGEEE
jgi:hypothetical protein